MTRIRRFRILGEHLEKEGQVGMGEEPMSRLEGIYACCSVRRDIWEWGLKASTAFQVGWVVDMAGVRLGLRLCQYCWTIAVRECGKFEFG